MSNLPTPFGIFFEERETECEQEVLIPEYDPAEGISYIIDSAGQCVPYIDWAWATFRTQTILATRIQRDPTDTDPGDDSPYYLT